MESSNAGVPIKCEPAGDLGEMLELSERAQVKLIENKSQKFNFAAQNNLERQ